MAAHDALNENLPDKRTLYDFTVKDSSGKDVNLDIYRGKVVLVVNISSQSSLAYSNYTELNEIYRKYKDQGFEILAFPCNQFGGQDPRANEKIVQFAWTYTGAMQNRECAEAVEFHESPRFKAEFPIFDVVNVNGENAVAVYKFLKAEKGGFIWDGIKWNFTKFLVDQRGHVVERFGPTTSPKNIEKYIKKLLNLS